MSSSLASLVLEKSCLCIPRLELQVGHHAHLSFTWILEIWTLVFKLGKRETICHLSSPTVWLLKHSQWAREMAYPLKARLTTKPNQTKIKNPTKIPRQWSVGYSLWCIGESETFKRWGLVKGGRSLWVCPWRRYWGSGPSFLSLSSSWPSRGREVFFYPTCYPHDVLHHDRYKSNMATPSMDWNLWNSYSE